MDLLPMVFSSGWASGVSAYLVVLVLGTALASHLVKAAGRLAIDASPERVTNVVASLGEDAAVTWPGH